MKAASISEIRGELKLLPAPRLTELCLRLARFKVENKELLTFLLYEAADIQAFIVGVKAEMDESFASLNTRNLYIAKKMLRKILRTVNKFIRFSGDKQVEVELLLHFCSRMEDTGVTAHRNTALGNLYKGQIKKIGIALDGLHEDLQHDYARQLEHLDLRK
jgi:hypothetical protein